uniref:hypothetical protein n=1 Tax=Ningiella ruwaisensis TaxID=2364274 RepID=UPI00109F67AF|nr:hypothetical protein [Ningiella ruwaisensis]
MNIKRTFIATAAIITASVSAPSLAQDSGVNQILSAMIKQAVSSAATEIDNQIETNILRSGNAISIEDLPATKVTITDVKASQKGEEVNVKLVKRD